MSSKLAIGLIISASVGGALSGVTQLKKTLGALKNTALSTQEKISSINTMAVSGMKTSVATLAGFGGSIMGLVNPAMEFESAMADVRKVVDFKTPEGFKKLSKDILELSNTIPMSAKELAAITASGGQLGVAEEDLKAFTTTIAKMSVAFDMSAEASGDAMAKLANVYKIPIEKIGDLGDAINELSNSSPAKASDIVTTLGRVGGVAKQFGLTETAAASLSNAFISLGKPPEVAGTAINGMLTKLMTAEKGGKAFQAALKEVGISAKQLKANIAKNGEGALVDFLKRLEKLPKEKAMGVLVDLFGREYADDVAVLAGNLDVLTNSLKTLQTTDANGKLSYLGSMNKEFAARAATTQSALSTLKNSLISLGISIGNYVLPIINDFVAWLQPLIIKITAIISRNKELMGSLAKIGAYVVGVIAGFSAMFGTMSLLTWGTLKIIAVFSGLWKIVGKCIISVISITKKLFVLMRLILGGLLISLRYLGQALLFIGRALLANPIIAIITGIALAAYLIYKYWGPIKAFFKALWAKVNNYFKQFCTWVKGVFTGAFEWVSAPWTGVTEFFSGLWTTVTGYFSQFATWVKGVFTGAFEWVSAPWTGVTEFFSGLWATVTGYFSQFATWVQGVFTGAFEWVSAPWTGVTEFFSGLWSSITGFFEGGISTLTQTITSFSPLSLFQQAFSSVLGWFGIDLPHTFSGFGTNLIGGLVNGIRNAWEKAKEMVSSLGSSIKAWFAEKLGIHSPSRVFMGYGVNVVEGLAIGMGKTQGLAKQASDQLSDAVTFKPVINSVEMRVKSNITSNQEPLPMVKPISMVSDAVTFKPVINSVETSIKPLANPLTTLWDGVKSSLQSVGNWLGIMPPQEVAVNSFDPIDSPLRHYEPLIRRETITQGNITVNFNPTIQITGDQPKEGIMRDITQAMQWSRDELERLVRETVAQDRDQYLRRAY